MAERGVENAWLRAQWLGDTLARLGDAVIGTDVEGRVMHMNSVAEDLTGWPSGEALGRPLGEVCPLEEAESGESLEIPTTVATLEDAQGRRAALVTRSGGRLLIEIGVLPTHGGGDGDGSKAAAGAAAGPIFLFRNATECDPVENAQAQLAAIVESSRDAIISKSLDGTIRTWNAGAERLFGYTAEEAIGQPIGLIVPPDREHEQEAILARLLEGERVEHFETVRQTRDGDLRFLSLTVSPICDRDGNVVGASKIARDITAQRENELERLSLIREIEEERSRLADVFDRAPSFMAVFRGPDHVYERANQRHADLVGGRDVIGKPLREALPELVEQEIPGILDEVYRTGEPYVAEEMNLQFRRTPGEEAEERCLEFVFQPLRDGSGAMSGILLQGIDLTERRQAEDDLARVTSESARQQRLHEAILSSTPDLVYVFSLDHRILYANDSLLGMWGLDNVEDAVGKRLLALGYEPWHAEMHEREIDEIRKIGRPIRGEVPFEGGYGRRMYDYLFVPVFGADGEVEAVAGTTRDVTERREMEDILRETDRNKDRFIALLAHELRNPLAPLRSGLQLMRLAGADANAVAEARGIMERQLEHLVRLVDDLLDISRLSQDKMELRRGTVRLSDVVESAVETAREAIDSAGHQLSLTLPPDPVYLDGDLTRLAQVFSNLLTNSAKYTEEGGEIRLTANAENDEVVVKVRDNGIGIPPEALPRVFDMFLQVDRPLERASGGLGIGLALVRSLVEKHDGTVSATSEGEGRGSTFTVRLPALPSDSRASPTTAEDAAGSKSARKRRVLVVDDNRDSAELMAIIFDVLGHEVHTAHDGVEAVEVAARVKPSIILMDIGMPRMNGHDATRKIRAQEQGPPAIILALTGWGQDEDRALSQAAGCDGHLVKPVRLPDLQRVLAELDGKAD
ncbi:hypothetical protein BH23GEM11_BH23GEM11_01850 [soil metagenome]